MSDQQPTVGRIVHYVSYGTPGGEYTSQCRAAIVTAVRDEEPVPEHGVPYVDLCVLNPTGMFFNQDCLYDEAAERGGTWHWPERAS
ncbi:hypothetical protein [Streptomyces sp. SID10815]|uniref:hypothetical protein n=1 Tax=Streptomyces sp. SID10815 TaxID=2706027 RepID=UPI001942FC78|nr:hypothetical protein [Streptomyces sp. SID10815]